MRYDSGIDRSREIRSRDVSLCVFPRSGLTVASLGDPDDPDSEAHLTAGPAPAIVAVCWDSRGDSRETLDINPLAPARGVRRCR